MTQLSDIIVKHDMGINNTKIASSMSISRPTVINWIKRYEETDTINRKIGSGRKKNLMMS